MAAPTFVPVNPSVEDCWRGIILYGQNSASYKFALAESLLKLNPSSGQLVKLEDLAPAFGKAIAEHISHSPKQGTNPGKFLHSVKSYNADGNLDALVKATVAGGFQNVIDAFHNILRRLFNFKSFKNCPSNLVRMPSNRGFMANSAAKEKNTKLSWLAEIQTWTSNFQGKAKCSQPFM